MLAVAAGGMSTTIAKASLFADLRLAIEKHSYYGGLLVRCPYCVAHWLVFGGVVVYQPRLIRGSSSFVDVIVTGFAIVTAATFIAALLCVLYWRRDD